MQKYFLFFNLKNNNSSFLYFFIEHKITSTTDFGMVCLIFFICFYHAFEADSIFEQPLINSKASIKKKNFQ